MSPRRFPSRTAALAACALAACALAIPAWSRSVTHVLSTGNGPRAFAVDAAARRVYVANEFSNSVSAINADDALDRWRWPPGIARNTSR